MWFVCAWCVYCVSGGVACVWWCGVRDWLLCVNFFFVILFEDNFSKFYLETLTSLSTHTGIIIVIIIKRRRNSRVRVRENFQSF